MMRCLCWLGSRKGIWPVKNSAGMVICLEWGANLHIAQLMPLPLTVSCFSKIQIGFTFLVQAHPGVPGQRAVKRVCVCYQPLDLRTSEWMAREYFTDSWRYDVFLISHNWIRRLVPIFLGTWGNCPKFHQKFDGTIICNIWKWDSILSKEG